MSDEHRGLRITYKGWVPERGYVFVNVRFGSLAVPLVNTSPMSASEGKADVQTAAILNTDSLLTANCGPNPTGLNCASGVYYIQGNECQALK